MRARRILGLLAEAGHDAIRELVRQHPIRNSAWGFDGVDFYAEDSSAQGLDPWNRRMERSRFVSHRDREGDITHWTYQTTVEGTSVFLTIFND